MEAPLGAVEESDRQRVERARQVRRWKVPALHGFLQSQGIRRAYILFENGRFVLSNEALAPLQAFLELSHDFSRHEAIFIAPSPERFCTVFTAFVHDTRRGLAQGGLRLRDYGSAADLLTDGLRLSQGMTRKNALAGLDWGGGKGIIPLPPHARSVHEYYAETEERKELFRAYGEFVASLDGVYYTAEDMGTGTGDMNLLLAANRYTTCIGVDRGGSGNPSAHTAWGVYRAMQAAWGVLNGGNEDLAGVRVAVQGAGNVGGPLIRYLVQKARARVFVADIATTAIAAIREHYPEVTVLSLEELYAAEVDIFAPCATGDVLNVDTIPMLSKSVKLVCGAANNQLREPEDAERMLARGIQYVPDYLCNRMGITNCADEWSGYLEEDVQLASERVYVDTLRVFHYARNVQVSTAIAADKLADIAASSLHPVLRHRGRRIQDHLRDIHWESLDIEKRSKDAARKWYEIGPDERRKKVLFVPSAHEPLMHRQAERNGRFSGKGPAVAAAPISTAGRPHLGEFLSPLLMDVACRARIAEAPRRVVGLDHGGSALQSAVEESLPYQRRDTARAGLVMECADYHARNGAEVRHQLAQAGIGFDATRWLDPMHAEVASVVERLYNRLKDARRISRGPYFGWRCPGCATVISASETTRGITRTDLEKVPSYLVDSYTTSSEVLPTHTTRIEYIPFAVGIAVRAKGPYAAAARAEAINPFTGAVMPIIVSSRRMKKGIDAELLVPGASAEHRVFCRDAGLSTRQQIYIDGHVVMPGGRLVPRDAAAREIAKRIGDALHELSEQGQLIRCKRCQSPIDPDMSEQTVLDLSGEAKELIRLIDSDVVALSSRYAKGAVLEQLRSLEPICISRQSWWGNEHPDSDDEVLSPWFSLAALSLNAAGWPAVAAPEPIDTVFVDLGFLSRWVVPSQLIALAICGRPAFRRVHVHGSVHVIERNNVQVGDDFAVDEERYVHRTVANPMDHRTGNVVEPASIAQRFGADALRLWYLLCLRPAEGPKVILREEQALTARRAIRRLNVTLSYLLEAKPDDTTSPRPLVADEAILVKLEWIGERARIAYETERFYNAAQAFLEAVERVGAYARAVSRREAGGVIAAATRATTVRIVRLLEHAFTPICPFILGHFASEVATAHEAAGRTYGWLADLVSLLSSNNRTTRLYVSQKEIRAILAAHATELEQVLGARFEIVDQPGNGRARSSGPFIRVDHDVEHP